MNQFILNLWVTTLIFFAIPSYAVNQKPSPMIISENSKLTVMTSSFKTDKVRSIPVLEFEVIPSDGSIITFKYITNQNCLSQSIDLIIGAKSFQEKIICDGFNERHNKIVFRKAHSHVMNAFLKQNYVKISSEITGEMVFSAKGFTNAWNELTNFFPSTPEILMVHRDDLKTWYKYDGNDLLEALKEEASGYERGIATGIISAFSGVAIFSNEDLSFCAPQGVRFGQLTDIVKAYLERNPSIRHKAVGLLIINSLQKAYPCK